MPKLIDNIYAVRLAVLLYRDWTTWDAYKHGIIDAKGAYLQAPKSPTQEASWTYLHRLAANLKRLIHKAPGGKSLIGKAVAHYALFKEAIDPAGTDTDDIDKELYERFDELFAPRVFEDGHDHLIEGHYFSVPEFIQFIKV